MNLVVALVVLGGGALAVYVGLNDSAGGVSGVLGRALRGEPETAKAAGGQGIAASLLAQLTSSAGSPKGTIRGDAAQRIYKLGGVKPHVATAAAEIGPMFGITTIFGVGDRTTPDSDHPKGLALDFMTKSKTVGDALAAYVLANAGRLMVSYVIYRQRINSHDGRGWRAMEDRGSPTANHMDHVHVSFVEYHPRSGGVSPGDQERL